MRHLPSIEALTAGDDKQLLAELEICEVKEKLAQFRALVDRADHLIATVLACGDHPALSEKTAGAGEIERDGELANALLATLSRRAL